MFFLLGAAAGAVVVALTTPKSGPDLRGDIKDLAGRLKRKAQEAGMTLCPECGEEGQHEHDEASGS
jgi:gas vesicle protein